MKMAAARAIADLVSPAELRPDFIVPVPFDRRVAQGVAAAVRDCAAREGVARPGLGDPLGIDALRW
jgi:malate dehydrogenase (oxaloacetate-decarboxylating)